MPPAKKKTKPKKTSRPKVAARQKKAAPKKARKKSPARTRKPAVKKAAPPGRTDREVLASTGVRVLVVDNDVEILELLQTYFTGRGVRVETLERGDLLGQALQRFNPTLVLLDVMLPNKSGWELCREIRFSTLHADVPVIMMTALDPRVNAATAPLYGATDTISKPFDLQELEEKLRQFF